jgi:DGQHR domain
MIWPYSIKIENNGVGIFDMISAILLGYVRQNIDSFSSTEYSITVHIRPREPCTMPKFLDGLVSVGFEINTLKQERGKRYIEKTVTGSTLDLAKEKASVEAKDGWEILKVNKKSVRLKKDKRFDEQLEDEVWTICARMGFKEISKDRNFKIYIDDKTPPRQIDVFVKDDETALIFECTGSDERKEKNLNTLIEKILSIRPATIESINKHYGKSPKLKVRYVIATKNIDWRKADMAKAEANGIAIIKEDELHYYKKLTDHLKIAAKYQLLAHLFANEKIHGLNIVVPATKGRMGGLTFYNFLIKPSDLLKISYISHKQSRDMEDLETYQRMLQPARLKSIADYIDNEGGQFPTNIVINIKTKTPLQFDKMENFGDSSFGRLHLPNNFATSWVIDGQHRLYGYAHSERAGKIDDSTTFPVLAYQNLPQVQEAKMFVDINCEQVRVNRNLLNEIYAGLNWGSSKFDERHDALCSRAIMRLNSLAKSPFFGRIIVSNTHKSSHRCLTLTSFLDGLKENKFFGEEKRSGFVPGPFSASYSRDLQDTLEKSVDIIIYFFSLFAQNSPHHWALGDAECGYLCTNNGVRAILRVLKEILTHVEHEIKNCLDDLEAVTICSHLDKYAEPLFNEFEDAPLEYIKRFRDNTALKGVAKSSILLMSLIHSSQPSFNPDKLSAYLETIDAEGTEEARGLIDDIIERMFSFTFDKLKENYKDEWWTEGVPEKVRIDCGAAYEKGKRTKRVEQYVNLIDYQSIAHYKWEIFKKYYPNTKEGGKEKQLEWIKRLNTIRNITHHREKWPATKEDVSFVREISKHVLQKFV